jgi:hypothetical protein
VFASRQRNQPVVCRATGNPSPGHFSMGGSRGTRTELQQRSEVRIDQRHRIGSIDARIARQSGQNRIRFRQSMPTKT